MDFFILVRGFLRDERERLWGDEGVKILCGRIRKSCYEVIYRAE